MYEQDYDDRLPPSLIDLYHSRHVPDYRLFICREDRFQGRGDPKTYWLSPWTSYFYLPDVNYGINYFLHDEPSWAGGWNTYVHKLGSSETKFVSDSWHYFPRLTLRLYLDGHVKTSR